jgi:hypothetical protein
MQLWKIKSIKNNLLRVQKLQITPPKFWEDTDLSNEKGNYSAGREYAL